MTAYPARTFTGRERLGFFSDAACQMLNDRELRLTLMTRFKTEGLDTEKVDRVLWDLEDDPPCIVASRYDLPEDTVRGLALLADEPCFKR